MFDVNKFKDLQKSDCIKTIKEGLAELVQSVADFVADVVRVQKDIHQASCCVLVIERPDGRIGFTQTVYLGHLILVGKPVVVVTIADAPVSAHLKKVALKIVNFESNCSAEEMRRVVDEAIAEIKIQQN